MMKHQKAWPWWRWVFTVLNIVALILSVSLSWHYIVGGAMAGCGGGNPCDQVLSSRWSIIAGFIPVSGLAVGVYLSMLIAGFFISSNTELQVRRLALNVMLVLAGSVAGSAIWFTILQSLIIKEFCIYCMSTHGIGFVLAILIIWRALNEQENISSKPYQKGEKHVQPVSKRILQPKGIVGMVFIGLLFSGCMAVLQLTSNSSAVGSGEKTHQSISKIDYNNVPIIGSPDASYVVTLLFDYQCSHCQKIHFMLNEVIRQYNGELAFILYPTPLENSCNPYVPSSKDAFKNSCELSKIGLAVWRANREVYAKFETWMFTYETGSRWHPRSLDGVKAKAIELLGKDKLEDALADPWIDSYLQNGIQLFGQTLQNGRGAIPKMIYNNAWVIPEPYNADGLVMILQKSIGVPKP